MRVIESADKVRCRRLRGREGGSKIGQEALYKPEHV